MVLWNCRQNSLAPSGGEPANGTVLQVNGLPEIVIEDEDSLDASEKAKMLRKYSIDTSKLGSKAKIFTGMKVHIIVQYTNHCSTTQFDVTSSMHFL